MPTDRSYADMASAMLLPENVRVRAMFGEYCLYHDDKPVAFICDNTVLLKPTTPLFSGAEELERREAYPGSKRYYVVPDDRLDTPWFRETVLEISSLVPAPKPKKKDVEKPTRRR